MRTSLKLILAAAVLAVAGILVYQIKVISEIKRIKANLPTSELGVWASEEAELVRTEKVSIFFVRTDSTVVSRCIVFGPASDSTIRAHVIAEVMMDSTKVLAQHITLTDSIMDKHNVGQQHDQYIIYNNRQTTSLLGGRMKVRGINHRMKLVEAITPDTQPQLLKANAQNIGTCLQQWSLGSTGQFDSTSITVQVGTNGHAYIFTITDNMIYCRAARMGYSNRGAYFAQNIRLMHNPNEHTAQMPKNCYKVSRDKLVMDSTMFNPTICVLDKEGIYWSLKSFNDTLIELHGCGGATYSFAPNRYKAEYFKIADSKE